MSGEQRKRSTTATLVKAATTAAIQLCDVDDAIGEYLGEAVGPGRDDPRDGSSSRGGWMKFALCYDV